MLDSELPQVLCMGTPLTRNTRRGQRSRRGERILSRLSGHLIQTYRHAFSQQSLIGMKGRLGEMERQFRLQFHVCLEADA